MKDTTLKSLSEVVDITADMAYDGNFITNHIWDYNDFLKQPLKIEMFIPCKDEVPLEEPEGYDIKMKIFEPVVKDGWLEKCLEYQKAKDRVLFKGFEFIQYNVKQKYITNGNKITIGIGEDLKLVSWKNNIIQDLCGKAQLVDKEHKQLNL